MGRRFNTAGACNPQRHYMVNLDERLRQIREDYVDEGSYFVIYKGVIHTWHLQSMHG